MRRLLLPVIASVITAAATAGIATARDAPGSERAAKAPIYSIGFWGDLPYSEIQKTTGVPNLIADMNRQKLAFSVHDGDIKAGGGRCDDSVYSETEAFFNSFTSPAIYTPGDNDWTDCDRPAAGAYNSAERLAFLRANLFDTGESFGQRRIKLEQQAAPYVENRRWSRGGVQYATLHVVGSDNNRSGDVAPDPAEWAARDTATNEWMRGTFAAARDRKAAGVLLVIQANPGFDMSDPTRAPVRDPKTLGDDGFTNFLHTLREETIAFRKPVVLVHGDSHYFRIDKPLQDAEGRRLENFTRLETPGNNAQAGNNEVHWTKVQVNTRDREVFTFRPQIVPANRTAVPRPGAPAPTQAPTPATP